MRRSIYFLVVVVFILTAIIPAARQADDNLSVGVKQKIDELAKGVMVREKVPAISIAVAYNNKIQYIKAFGKADLENSVTAKEQTVFRTASIAKTITATAVMQLAEKRQIDLDSPIQKYCPVFPQKKWPVTVRQLLGHLGGVRHYNNTAENNGTGHYNSIVDSLSIFKDDPLVFQPGTQFNYTTYGYSLLGCAIEKITGKSYEEYIDKNIFKPSGMTHTDIDDSLSLIPNRAHGYVKNKAGKVINAPLHDTSMKVAGGGLVSTPEDLVKFAIALNSNKLLSRKYLDLMWTRQTLNGGTKTGYGLGWGVGNYADYKTVGHSGGQAGTATYLQIAPEKGVAVAVMTNLQGFGVSKFTREITGIILSK